MQKALWVRKDNPNAAALQAALTAMSKDPKATANIQKKVGCMIGRSVLLEINSETF
jgi:hypothetical protein